MKSLEGKPDPGPNRKFYGFDQPVKTNAPALKFF